MSGANRGQEAVAFAAPHSSLEQDGRVFVSPEPRDVICGQKGLRASTYPGNRLFRQIILLNSDKYANSKSKLERICLVRSIVFCVREAGGRFIRHDKDTNQYYDIGDGEAREKTRHALRFLSTKKDASSTGITDLRPSSDAHQRMLNNSPDFPRDSEKGLAQPPSTQGDTNWALAESIVSRAGVYGGDRRPADSFRNPRGISVDGLRLPSDSMSSIQASREDVDRRIMLELQAEKLRSLEMLQRPQLPPSLVSPERHHTGRFMDDARQRPLLGDMDPILSSTDEILLRRRRLLRDHSLLASEAARLSSFEELTRLRELERLQQSITQSPLPANPPPSLPSLPSNDAMMRARLMSRLNETPSYASGISSSWERFQPMERGTLQRSTSLEHNRPSVNVFTLTSDVVRDASNVVASRDQQYLTDDRHLKLLSQSSDAPHTARQFPTTVNAVKVNQRQVEMNHEKGDGSTRSGSTSSDSSFVTKDDQKEHATNNHQEE